MGFGKRWAPEGETLTLMAEWSLVAKYSGVFLRRETARNLVLQNNYNCIFGRSPHFWAESPAVKRAAQAGFLPDEAPAAGAGKESQSGRTKLV